MSKPSSERVREGSGRIAALAVAMLVLGACGSGGGGTMGAAGTGTTTGAAGTGTRAAGTGTGAAGTGMTTGAAGTGTGAAGSGTATGAAGSGTPAGVAGSGAAGSGAAGSATMTGAAGTIGAAGTTGAAGSGAAGSAAGTGAAGSGPFALTSSAFQADMRIPLPYKCAQVPPPGMNQSPPLTWTPGPAGTKSYAVTLNHDAADNSAHWALWDIPITTTSLPANIDHVAMPPVPAGSKQATQNLDGFTGIGYLGPCPQAVNSRQMYRFTVWALNVDTLGGVTSASTTAAAQTAIKNAAVPGGSATLIGTQIQIP